MRLNVRMQEGNTTLPSVFRDVQTETVVMDSPHFTGIPTAPTAPSGTKTTQIATTEFVNTEIRENTALYTDIVYLDITEVRS